jgi:hypothetical protein
MKNYLMLIFSLMALYLKAQETYLCSQGATTTLTATATSGVAPFSYKWINITDNDTFYTQSVVSGTDEEWTWEITDSNGCKAFGGHNVYEYTEILGDQVGWTHPNGCVGVPIDIEINPHSNNANVSVNWGTGASPATSPSSTINRTIAVTYSTPGVKTITVTGTSYYPGSACILPCTDSFTFTINVTGVLAKSTCN